VKQVPKMGNKRGPLTFLHKVDHIRGLLLKDFQFSFLVLSPISWVVLSSKCMCMQKGQTLMAHTLSTTQEISE
jgi:hypothetical protein